MMKKFQEVWDFSSLRNLKKNIEFTFTIELNKLEIANKSLKCIKTKDQNQRHANMRN